MPILGIDLSCTVEVLRDRKSKQVLVDLKQDGDWAVYIGCTVDSIDMSVPVIKICQKGCYCLPYSENKRYYFKFRSSQQEFIIAEKRLPIQGASNFRDLGGIRLLNGGSVKWGKLFRSDELSRLTDSDLQYLDSIPIKSIIDFRSRSEIRKWRDRFLGLTQFIHFLPISPGGVKSSANPQNSNTNTLTEQMQNMYANYIIDIECINAFRLMFKILQYDLSAPLLLHCSAGKDRTGIAVALILFALGVSEDEVMRDYMLSRSYLPPKYKAIVSKYPRMRSMFTVKRSYLETAIGQIKKQYGSIDFFLTRVLKVDIVALRKNYIESN